MYQKEITMLQNININIKELSLFIALDFNTHIEVEHSSQFYFHLLDNKQATQCSEKKTSKQATQ